MANTKNKTTKNTIKTNISENKVKKNEEVKEQVVSETKDNTVAQLQEMVKMLQEQVQNLLKEKQEYKEEAEAKNEIVSDNPTRMIKVISLCPNALYLSQGERGEGKIYSFPTMGSKKMIPANILDDIVSSHLTFAEKGYFYICDKQFIEEHGLENEYQQMKSPEIITTILTQDNKTFKEVLSSCSDGQFEIILDYIVNSIVKGEILLDGFEDDGRANILTREYRKRSGKDYNLREKIDDLIVCRKK